VHSYLSYLRQSLFLPFVTLILWCTKVFIFWQYWGLSSGPYICKASTLPLEPHPQTKSFKYG
jgi:hypothetical protein